MEARPEHILLGTHRQNRTLDLLVVAELILSEGAGVCLISALPGSKVVNNLMILDVKVGPKLAIHRIPDFHEMGAVFLWLVPFRGKGLEHDCLLLFCGHCRCREAASQNLVRVDSRNLKCHRRASVVAYQVEFW